LRAIYLALTPIVAQLQGAVDDRVRSHGDTAGTQEMVQAFGRVRASHRQTGLDIRLASEAATMVGLEEVFRAAEEMLSFLEQ
jgi:hypothetical protein